MGAAMLKFHTKLWTLTIVWTLVLSGAFYLLFSFSPGSHLIRPHKLTETMSNTAAGSGGAARLDVLVRDTSLYVKQNPDAAPDVVAGKALAPAEFLNDQLKRDGEKFRVRKVEGLHAEMYDVS